MNVYHDRMPVILPPEDFDRWLSGEMTAEELGPAPEEALHGDATSCAAHAGKARAIAKRMNSGDD